MTELDPPQGAQLLRLTLDLEDDVVRLALAGELDVCTAKAVRAQLDALEPGFSRLVVDLRRLTFMDSTGVRLLLDVHDAAGRDGHELVVVNGSRPVARVLELTGVDRLLPLVNEDDGAGG